MSAHPQPDFKEFVDQAGLKISALSEYVGTGEKAPASLKDELQGLMTNRKPLGQYLDSF